MKKENGSEKVVKESKTKSSKNVIRYRGIMKYDGNV
jgi:hypothetical protein